MKTRIKKLREEKKISQTCLGAHVGCSQNMISKIELEIAEPRANLLLELSRYFNVSIDYILYNTDYKYLKETSNIAKNINIEQYFLLKKIEKLEEQDRKLISSFIERLTEKNKV